MKKQASGYVQDELATIESLLASSQGQTAGIQNMISALKSGLASLD
jgi:hypothetical protein